jgi:hypothetical protein
MLLQIRDGQQLLQRQIADLRQALKGDVNFARESARDANDRFEKQMVQGFQMLDGRLSFIQTLLVLILVTLVVVLGGALLIWQRLMRLEQGLAPRLTTVEQRVSDILEQSK